MSNERATKKSRFYESEPEGKRILDQACKDARRELKQKVQERKRAQESTIKDSTLRF